MNKQITTTKHSQLTQKQHDILSLIPRFRYIDYTHIQSLFHHKDRRQINRWLQDLMEKNYLLRYYDKQIIGKNRLPAIYFLDNRGIQYIKNLEIYDKRFLSLLYHGKNRSDTFITHCLLIATTCCELAKKNTQTLQYDFVTESDRSHTASPFHFLKTADIHLNLCLRKKQSKKHTQWYLLTLLEDTLPHYRVRSILRQYKDFYLQNIWEDTMHTAFPDILFVFQSKAGMIYAKRYIKILFSEDNTLDITIHVTTIASMHEHGVTGNIWE